MQAELKYVDAKENILLKQRTSFKVGGKARYFFVAHSIEDLQFMLTKAASIWGGFYVLGSGSNILVSDEEIIKPVITLGEEFRYIKRLDEDSLEVGAATPLAQIISYTVKERLKGLEHLVAIPASFGGLLVMNASSFGRDVASCVEEVLAVTSRGKIHRLKREDIVGHRRISFSGCVVVSVRIKLTRDSKVRESLMGFLNKRLSSQDFSHPSAGCIFKNVNDFSAGYLIEKCGLKGFGVGNAQVSLRHANFIINKGNAKAKDVARLIAIIKEKVYREFSLVLEEEIVRWGI